MICKSYLLMLKHVYPCASKTFEVLSYCAVMMYGRKLYEKLHSVYYF